MKHYDVNELEIQEVSQREQIRTRIIFEDLKKRAIEGKKLLEREKDFLYIGLKLSELDDGKPEDFKACENNIFKELYLTYFHNNLSGPFFKHKKGQGLVEVGFREKIKDMSSLMRISDKWLVELKNDKHSDQILQEIGIETRRDLKVLEEKYPSLKRKFKKHQDDYRLKKDKIILQSKFIYLLVKSVIENNDSQDFEIPFSNEIIEFTIYSLVHIVSRHYAEPIKDNPDKTYHYDYFYPTELHLDLKNILTKIDSLNKIDVKQTDNIIFEFKNIKYQIWIQKRFKQVKGQGNVEIFRIQTFYPIYSEIEIKKIESEYEKTKADDELFLLSKS